MGTGWLFTQVDDIVGGAFTGVGTLLSWNLGSIIIFILAFAFVGLVIHYIKKAVGAGNR